jgi:hypothetical protein
MTTEAVRFLWKSNSSRIFRGLTFAAMLGGLSLLSISPASAQDPQDQQQDQPPPPPQDQPAPYVSPDGQPAPPPPGSDSRPVISRDTIPQDQGQYPQNAPPPPPSQRPPAQYRRPMASAPSGPVPTNLTVPAGTVIFARVNEPLSSDHNHAGDTFTATLDRPLIVNGWVVARRGETILGTVTTAQKAGRVKGVSQLGLEVTDITVVDGQQLPVLTELWKGSAGTSHGADAAAITSTTAAGTIIGAAANGGTGAGVGAGAGAVAGIALVLLTRGKPTVIGPESLLTFQLKDPVSVNTTNSQQAFQPVGPNDYGPSMRRAGGDAYVSYPPACGPYGCSASYYPYGYYYGPYWGPSIGFGYYGGYYRGGFGRWGFRR